MGILNTGSTEGSSIVVVGELLIDIIDRHIPGAKPEEVPGGAPANFAYRFHSRQASGAQRPVALVSCVGKDPHGDEILKLCRERNIDTTFIQRHDIFATGTVNVTHRGDQEVTYVINKNAAYDHIKLTPELLDLARRAKVFYFGSLIQREAQGSTRTLRAMLEVVRPDAVKFVDINLRNDCYDPPSLRWSISNASILKLNDKEWPELAQAMGMRVDSARSFAEQLVAAHNKTVIVTLAEKGAFVVSRDLEHVRFDYTPGYDLGKELLQRFDTIGCGDSFGAEYTRLHLEGNSVRACLIGANEIAAAAALTSGGQSPIGEEQLAIVRSRPRIVAREYERDMPA